MRKLQQPLQKVIEEHRVKIAQFIMLPDKYTG